MIQRSILKLVLKKKSDTQIIYSTSCNINIEQVLSYELYPGPTVLFEDSGEMRMRKIKMKFETLLKEDVASQTVKSDRVFIDESALLRRVIPWPDRLNQIAIGGCLSSFDRYYDFSPKYIARQKREVGFRKVTQLSFISPLPPKKSLLWL